jgi:nitric oxide reductase large subunit
MSSPSRSPMTVSPLFVQAILVTFLVGFGIMGYLAIKVYQDHPPLPGRVVSDAGQTVFTADDTARWEHFCELPSRSSSQIKGDRRY